jgi:cell division protein FtsB
MFRRPADQPLDDAPPTGIEDELDPIADGPDGDARPVGPDLAALPIAGITRRRMAALLGVLLAAWIVVVFARQVGEASAATAKAEDIAAGNVALRQEVTALQGELGVIGRPEYVSQQARGYGLGSRTEISFRLAPDAPALPADAPGSAAVRLGSELTDVSPLERWLTLLFGPSD